MKEDQYARLSDLAPIYQSFNKMHEVILQLSIVAIKPHNDESRAKDLTELTIRLEAMVRDFDNALAHIKDRVGISEGDEDDGK